MGTSRSVDRALGSLWAVALALSTVGCTTSPPAADEGAASPTTVAGGGSDPAAGATTTTAAPLPVGEIAVTVALPPAGGNLLGPATGRVDVANGDLVVLPAGDPTWTS